MKLTSSMQDVTVFLHVSSYAPTPTPVPPPPPSALFTSTPVPSLGQQQQPPAPPQSLSLKPGVSPLPRPFSPATFMPAAALSNAGTGGGIGIGPVNNEAGGLSYSADERSGGFVVAGPSPGFLSRSKSATAGPTALKHSAAGTMTGGGSMTGGGTATAVGKDLLREPPHTALPQNQASWFGH